jgi:hypothetical protein
MIQFETDLQHLDPEALRRAQREGIDTWDLGTVAKVLHDLGEWYSLEIIWTQIESLPLAVSRKEFGDSFLKDRFVPYHPFFAAQQKPPLTNPSLFSRTYSACQHVLAVLYDPFRSQKHTFPPAWAMHFELWNDTSDLCHRCREEQGAGLPQA